VRTGPELGREAFRLLRDLIHGHCGIFFDEDTAFLLERRLAGRVAAHALADYDDYVQFLLAAGAEARRAELDEIVDVVTTNETYFFREPQQLAAFREEILPHLAETRPRGRRLSVWSAGCSTGEEPYTIAIELLESGLFAGWDLAVFGSDISRRVLQVARRGVYGRASFRATDPARQRRWFTPVDGGKHQIIDEVRRLVRFGHVNLIDDLTSPILGEVDVVFCRNVLIYFDQSARRRTIDHLYKKLCPKGFLLLGHSESLLSLSTAFELVHMRNDMVYRKP
jgi:chemotaxis protein methyltransferase CheR